MKKEINTIMFVLIIIVGIFYSLSLRSNAELTKTNLIKNIKIHQMIKEGRALEKEYEISSQMNLIFRGYIKGRAEKELLKDQEYLKLITN
jgi:hypothetical protein